ncbi:TPA: hypothetical protein ACJSVV_001264 [Streptococcus agalactiae]
MASSTEVYVFADLLASVETSTPAALAASSAVALALSTSFCVSTAWSMASFCLAKSA